MSYAGLPSGFTVADQPKGATYHGLPEGFQVEPKPNTSSKFGSEMGRQVGLTGRYLAEGALSLPATIADVPGAAYNAGADLIQGQGKGYRVPEQNNALSDVLTKIGLPSPQTGGERIVGDISRGVAGAGSVTGAAKGITGTLAKAMTASPGKAVISGGLAGGASGGAREAGLPVPVQMAAGLVAGAAPYMSPAALASGGKLTPNEQQATAAGYKLNPATMENPSVLSKLLGGWSGKVKTQQAASAANQETTNGLAASDLGLPKDTILDDNAFEGIRKTAGQAYQAVKSVVARVVPDQQFQADAAKLGSLNGELAKDFPELVKNDGIDSLVKSLSAKKDFSTKAGLDAVKTLRADGTKNLQAIGDPQKNALGFAQRQAAEAIDALIERNLTAQGNKPMVDAYRAARQRIAKSYDVEAATNPATGDVSAAKLSQIGNRRPLTGGLDTIATVGNAFPKAVQNPGKFGGVEPLSTLDLGAAGFAAAHGKYGLAASLLGKPAARSLIMSDSYQRAIANQGSFSQSAASLPAAQLQPLIRALSQKRNSP